MSEQARTSDLPLFASVTKQTPELEWRFRAVHAANPQVYRRLEEKALDLVKQGRTRIGIAELVEDLRYDFTLRTTGEPFKLNNSHRAFYARMLIQRRPELAAVVETRKQKSLEAAS